MPCVPFDSPASCSKQQHYNITTLIIRFSTVVKDTSVSKANSRKLNKVGNLLLTAAHEKNLSSKKVSWLLQLKDFGMNTEISGN